MVKVHVHYVPGGNETREPVETFEVFDEVKPPSLPMWGLPLLDGDVVFLNMAMVRQIRMEKEKIAKA